MVHVQRDEEFDEQRSDVGFPSNSFPRPEFAMLHFSFLKAGSKETRLYVQGAKGTMPLSPAHNRWDEPRASMADSAKRVCLHCWPGEHQKMSLRPSRWSTLLTPLPHTQPEVSLLKSPHGKGLSRWPCFSLTGHIAYMHRHIALSQQASHPQALVSC